MVKYMLDTNVLMDYPEAIQELDRVLIPIIVLEELDNLKRDKFKGKMAREAHRVLKEAKNIEYITKESFKGMPDGWDSDKNDNKIIMAALEYDCILVTNDINMMVKASSLNIKVVEYYQESYTGFYEVNGVDNINNFFKDFEEGRIKLHTNQYVLLNDGEKESEFRYDGKNLFKLCLPGSEVVKGWNAKQRCAIDLLYNDNIPIKVIAGNYGSGKTKLSAMMAVHKTVEKGKYSCIEMIRNPIGSGEEIGFLTGGFEEKTARFFQPIIDCLEGGEQTAEVLVRNEILKKNVPYFMKGLTRTNTFMLVDEAEDLSLPILKLIGSRLGENSVIVFAGDYKQAEGKYISNNGLVQFMQATKDEPLVGVVVLDDDVRSSASKVFSLI